MDGNDRQGMFPAPQTPPQGSRSQQSSTPDDGTIRQRTPERAKQMILYINPSYKVEIIQLKRSSNEMTDNVEGTDSEEDIKKRVSEWKAAADADRRERSQAQNSGGVPRGRAGLESGSRPRR